MSNNVPFISDKKRSQMTDMELNLYYQSLEAYYASLPFSEEENITNENYYRRMANLFSLLRIMKGTIVLNKNMVQNQKGIIYVSNHIGSFDQFYMTGVLGNRPLHYLVKEKVTTWPIRWNLIYQPTGVVIVDQSSISSWKEAKQELVQYLLHGKDIFIFPEGTRRGEDNLGKFQPGVAQVIQESQAPVTTLAIKNSAKLLSLKRPIVCVGETLSFDSRSSIRLITETIQDHVYANYEQIVAYEKRR